MGIKFEMCVVPPGGGEANFYKEIEAATLPKKGDYINLKDNKNDMSVYLVNEVVHFGAYNEEEDPGTITGIRVFVEPVEHSLSSESHKLLISSYKTKGYEVKEFPDTGY